MWRALIVMAVMMGCDTAKADGLSRIGNFRVEVEKDRFNDRDKVVASVFQGGDLLAIRCLRGELSLAFISGTLGQSPWKADTIASIKIKTDNGPVVETIGSGLNDRGLEIVDKDGLIASLAGSKEIALRIVTDDVSFDKVFSLTQSSRALAPVLKACETVLPKRTPPTIGMTPPPTTGETTSDLNSKTEEVMTGLAPLVSASRRCDLSLNFSVVADHVSASIPSSQTYDFTQLLAASIILINRMETNEKWADTSTEETARYCEKAKSDYGAGGVVINGAFN